MLRNRSMPEAVIIPTLGYTDVREAVAWLCDRFGFSERLTIGEHRAQLTLGGGAVVVTALSASAQAGPRLDHSIMVRVADVERHYQESVRKGVEIVSPPTDHAYGERQYTARDPGGHVWTFSESRADVDPAKWGGVLRTDGAAGRAGQ